MSAKNPDSAPRRDGTYWFGLVVSVAALAGAIREGWTLAAVWMAFLIGIVLAVPTAYDIGRRHGR